MIAKSKQDPQQPLVLRAHRLMDAFAKSDDERDFYLDRLEGFIIYADLDKTPNELEELDKELSKNYERYCMIPKLSFYETKKIMEGFVNEKVYDIDTKEKLIDIIQSKEARTNFLEFIYDHLTELEKWQQFYQERARIRIIEWLRQNHFNFVFEEDLELSKNLVEKLKQSLFQANPHKDILAARKALITKAKTYYSNEALNPRPKRGRPPKQAAKQEIELQFTGDIYQTASPAVRPFLFIPDTSSTSGGFSTSFETPEFLASRKAQQTSSDTGMENFQQKLAALRSLSSKWLKEEEGDEEEDEDDEEMGAKPKSASRAVSGKAKSAPVKPAKKVKKAAAKPKAKPKPPKKFTLRPIIKANNKNDTTPQGKKKHKRIIPVQKPEKKTNSLRKITQKKSSTRPKPVIKASHVKARPMVKKKPIIKKPIAKPKAVVKVKPRPLKKLAPRKKKR